MRKKEDDSEIEKNPRSTIVFLFCAQRADRVSEYYVHPVPFLPFEASFPAIVSVVVGTSCRKCWVRLSSARVGEVKAENKSSRKAILASVWICD